MNPVTVALFGISGSGKGTQAELLAKFLKDRDASRAVLRTEMGDLARTFTKSGTDLASRADDIISHGGLLPSFLPIYLLTKRLNESFSGEEHLILDGTFRKPLQSIIGDEIVRFYGRKDLHVIMLTLTKETARERLIARGRPDDATEEAMRRRFEWYHADVVPAYNVLKERGWITHEIDGNRDIGAIHRDIVAALNLT